MTELPEGAAPAWLAYNAMEATKNRHFTYLSGLEARYKKYGSPSAEEEQLRARLLRDHDAQVEHFKSAMQHLRTSDAAAHQAFVTWLAEMNSALAPFQSMAEH